MPFARSPLIPVAFISLGVWLSGAAQPLAAEEAATAIASPAARWGAVAACRIVAPTFVPDSRARASATPTRYPGGARLSRPVAEPCPQKSPTTDV
jgi:hypothetical protein